MASSADGVRAAGRIPTVVIVHKPVAVVVNTIARHFCSIDPMVVNQIDVVVVGAAALEDCDDNAVTIGGGATGRNVPSQVGIDVVVRPVHVVPLRSKLRVVGCGALFNVMVHLSRLHKR